MTLPWAHARVVKACHKLSATDKLIWLEHAALLHKDGPGGTCISAKGLGGRVGVSRVTVERARHEFLRYGLITKRDRGQGRTDDWYPCLPRGCRPTGQRLTEDDLDHYAELLDTHIALITTITEPHSPMSEVETPPDPIPANLTHPVSELHRVRESQYDAPAGRPK